MNNIFNLALQGIANKFGEMGFPVRKVTEHDDSDGATTLPSIFFDPMPHCCKTALSDALVYVKNYKASEIQLICLEDDTCETCALDDGTACLMLSLQAEQPFSDDIYNAFLLNLNDVISRMSQSDMLDKYKWAWELSDSLLNKVHEDNMAFLNTLKDVGSYIKDAGSGKLRATISKMHIRYLLADRIEDLRYALRNDQLEKLLTIDNIAESLCNSVSIREEFYRTIEDGLFNLIHCRPKENLENERLEIVDNEQQESTTDVNQDGTNPCMQYVRQLYVHRGSVHIFCNPHNLKWFTGANIKPNDFVCILYSTCKSLPEPSEFKAMMNYIGYVLASTNRQLTIIVPNINGELCQQVAACLRFADTQAYNLRIMNPQKSRVMVNNDDAVIEDVEASDHRAVKFSFNPSRLNETICVIWDTEDNMNADLDTNMQFIKYTDLKGNQE